MRDTGTVLTVVVTVRAGVRAGVYSLTVVDPNNTADQANYRQR